MWGRVTHRAILGVSIVIKYIWPGSRLNVTKKKTTNNKMSFARITVSVTSTLKVLITFKLYLPVG